VELGRISEPGLLLGPIAYTYDVYWDGQRIGDFGAFSRGYWFVPRWHTFPVPRNLTSAGTHVVAVRIDQIGPGVGLASRQPRVHGGDNRVGELPALFEAESAQMSAEFQPRLLQLLVDCGLLLAGVYFLLLPPSVSQGAAFRWLGVVLLSRALTVMCEFYWNFGPLNVPGSLIVPVVWAFIWLTCIAVIEFSYALFRRPVPLAIRGLECLLVALAAPVPLPYSAIPIRLTVLLVPAGVAVALAWVEFRKHTVDAGLTLVLFAVLAATILYNALALTIFISYGIIVPISIGIAGFWVWCWDIQFLLWVPPITIQVHKANLRVRDERERLRGEMEAARHIQEVLVPSQSIRAPGFEIDVSYQPATEVGGDFFQLFSASNDSLLVVVGDVSGKGMKAALVVCVIVGALQNRKSDAPAALLGELNAVLLGRSEGGFTTCCCALFTADGMLTIANAGHVAPYRNEEEIETAPALPLGIDADALWTELRIELEPGDRVLWVSDGVIEARNSKRDLLGFQRAQELATRSASEIARAAQQFGQEDDITVVSITRQPVPVHVG
jgi:hypothetical protein